MLKQLNSNQNGIVFITVLSIILVIAILTVGIIQLNLNQAYITEGEIKRIQLEAVAKGALALVYANLASDYPTSSNTITYNVTIGNQVYNVFAQLAGAGLTGTNTNTLNIYVTPY